MRKSILTVCYVRCGYLKEQKQGFIWFIFHRDIIRLNYFNKRKQVGNETVAVTFFWELIEE